MKRVLVIRLSSLGDVILTAPVYKYLKAHWPDCSISVLVKPQFAAALEGNPHVDHVIPFRGLKETFALIRSQGFTHLLDLHGNLRSFILRRFAGIAAVSVYRKNALARRLFVAFGLRSPALEKHTVERYLDALAAWGVPTAGASLSLSDAPSAPASQKLSATNALLIQSAFLGDSLLTLPLARDIKSLLPRCRLTVLTLPGTADIFRQSSWVDEVVFDDKRGEHGGLSGTWKLSRQLRKKNFDLAVIPHRSFRSAWLAWLSRIPERVGFSSSAGRLFLTRTVPFTWLMHDLERNLALAKALGPDIRVRADESLYVSQDAEESRAVSARLAQEGVKPGEIVVGVHPGSAWPTKRWLAPRFAELCRRLAHSGRKVVLVGGRQDAELCAKIAEESGAVDWSGKTTLNELKALMGRLSLFITNDSGPMHLATACGVPTLAVFGPTTRELGFFPYGPDHRVLESDLPCRPCGLHGAKACPEGHFLCMNLITTDEVFKNAEEMLASSRAVRA